MDVSERGVREERGCVARGGGAARGRSERGMRARAKLEMEALAGGRRARPDFSPRLSPAPPTFNVLTVSALVLATARAATWAPSPLAGGARAAAPRRGGIGGWEGVRGRGGSVRVRVRGRRGRGACGVGSERPRTPGGQKAREVVRAISLHTHF